MHQHKILPAADYAAKSSIGLLLFLSLQLAGGPRLGGSISASSLARADPLTTGPREGIHLAGASEPPNSGVMSVRR